jgi:putative transposase
MLTTWHFRIKDSGSSGRVLSQLARSVNFVWNFCKATQIQALKRQDARIIVDKKSGEKIPIANFFSAYELNNLTSGSAKELGIHSQSVQAVCEEYVTRRKQFKKLLRWRGKKSLGWIPFKKVGVQIHSDSITYCKKEFRFWESRDLPEDAQIKSGSFTQDKRGRWYVSITFESESLAKQVIAELLPERTELGIDLGIKKLATLSDGQFIERPDLRAKALVQIRKLEKQRRYARRQQARARKFAPLPKEKRLKKLHTQIANQREDYLHKKSTELVNRSQKLVVGDLSCRFMNRSRNLSGISLDTGIGMFKQMLRYKAERAGVEHLEVSERNSTQTCSGCGWQHPPHARIGLEVREWTCPQCGAWHDRDINAARNILRSGHRTPIRSAA